MRRREDEKYDYMVKVVIVGDSAVGKTNMLLRFVNDEYKISHITTIGVDYKVKILPLQGANIKMQIWDTAGQERFKTITETYYKGSAGIVFVYSVTDRKSFDNISNWIRQVNDSQPESLSKIIVGNKCDCPEAERQVSLAEGRRLAESYGIPFLEASAKENTNIMKVFTDLGEEIKTRLMESEKEGNNRGNSLKLDNIDKGVAKKEGCEC